MSLKYQNVLAELSITDVCPPAEIKPIIKVAYRWVFEPIENKLNFLPNYLFDKARDNTDNYFNGKYDNVRKCFRSSQSLYLTLDAAKINHKKLSQSMRDKLGYTHVAQGQILDVDGWATEPNEVGHFSFYESEKCDFAKKFSICDNL